MRHILAFIFVLLFIKSSFSADNRLIRIDFPAGNRDQSGIIQSIYQDYLGYIWIGQNNGLFCFDGYDFRKIPTISESEFGISNSNINCIYEDSDSVLWIGTKGGGLNRYDRKTDSYTIFTNDPDNSNSITFNDIMSIYEDSNKVIWVGTNGAGLNFFDKKTQTFKRIIDSENPVESSSEKVLSICSVSADELYIGTWGNGLKKINLKTGKWKQIFSDMKSFPLNSRRNIWSITDLGSGQLLLGTFGEGALVFDQNKFQVSKLKGSSAKRVFSGCRDSEGVIYLSSDRGLEIIKNGKAEVQGPSGEVRAINFDRDGHLWVGQKQDLWALKKLPPFFGIPKASSGAECSTLYVDKLSFLWVTFPEKLLRINLTDRSSTVFPLPKKISVNMISDWNTDTLILATNEGVVFFDKLKGRLIQVTKQSPAFQEFIKGNANFCAQTPDSARWISILGTLYRNKKGEEKFISEKLLPSFSMSHHVSAAIQDSDGSTWLGTFGGGLNHITPELDHVQVFKQNFVSKDGLSNNFIACLLWDRLHRLWIGTHDGLNLMTDAVTGKFRTFTVKDGLPNNEINSMVADRDGFLWLGTSNGLCRLNPENMEIRIFGVEDGLPSSFFLNRSAFLLENGEIVMGTNLGAIQFNPKNIPEERITPRFYLQSFRLFNEEIHPKKNTFLELNPLFTESIRLNYKQNYIGISFSSLPFFRKENTSYSYQLTNVDHEWQFTKSNSINYTNLAPGGYLLKVKSIDGPNISAEHTLQIVILPPWWKSKFAYWTYGLLVILSLFLIGFLITRRERNKGQVMLQKYKVQKEKEVNDLKFAFFSQVSNELKNPLTLLMNPLSEMISASNPELKTQLSVMQSGAFQMKRILEQLVDFKKIGTGEHQPNLSVGNIPALLTRICQKYAACANSGGKIFHFEINPETLFARFDAGLLTKIHGNVLDFFFNRSVKNSEINFESGIISIDERPFLSVSVSDQQGGLTPPQLKLLLEPFSGGDSGAPFGFGMAITSELVRLCQGKIQISNFGEGLRVQIELPVELNTETTYPTAIQENISHQPLVLLVINHEGLRTYLSDSFSHNYRIAESEFAEKSIALMEDKIPDLIICDFELKGMDGLQFYRQLIENPKTESIPFILLNGEDDQTIKLDALNAGVHSFIVKPFNMEELQAIVRNYFFSRKNLKKELTSDSQSIQLLGVEITSPQKELLNRVLIFMENNYSDPGLSVEMLCVELNMSRPQLYRKLQTLTGLSVQEFIKSFRLKKAATFLRSGELRISDVAYQTGFSDPQHFSKSFKSQFGKSPTQYAAEHKA